MRVATHRAPNNAADDTALFALFGAIASRDHSEVARWLASRPDLAGRPIRTAATRANANGYFLEAIHHYVYAGDTALHVAAAAYQHDLVRSLVTNGADLRATNRRRAQPLHYAADGGPDTEHWDPAAQRDVISYLIGAGADPNAVDGSGVAPLHRAVRNRCSAAVRALIENGADPLLTNRNGSTPLHLAVQPTGKSNSGSESAKAEQRKIVALLLQHGARPTDVDANGRPVADAATSDWIRVLLDSA